MRISRRDWLKIGALGGTSLLGSSLVAGCSKIVERATSPALSPIESPPAHCDPIVRLLNRVTFGPAPGDVTRVKATSVEKFIEEQLHPDDNDEIILLARLRSVEVFQSGAVELRDLHVETVLHALQKAAILRAVYSRHQLRERMVDFWSNHFNIYARKGDGTYFLPNDQLQVIRRHALGKFPDLLRASAQSPAMLAYLDNTVNRKGRANENYARELMELHTLGVHGGYTQKDVQEVARCFTGWTVENRFLHRRGHFYFDTAQHDDGAKLVLGHKILAGGGAKDVEQVMDILAHHPATAHFISHKLCRYFLGENVGQWPEKMAEIYLKSDGDIRQMLRPLLLSDDLQKATPIMKRPFDFLVSSLRALRADTDGGKGAQKHLTRMGQPLYLWPMPDGYPDATQAWTGSLLARWNFALALTRGAVEGTKVNVNALLGKNATPDALIELIFSRHAEDELLAVRDKVARHLSQNANSSQATRQAALREAATLLLASPQFQWR